MIFNKESKGRFILRCEATDTLWPHGLCTPLIYSLALTQGKEKGSQEEGRFYELRLVKRATVKSFPQALTDVMVSFIGVTRGHVES